MEEILKVDLPGFKASYNVKWFDDINFSNLNKVKQVYGIIFNNEGKILIVNTVGNWQIPGGKPEIGESFEETLIRECVEEANAEIENITPLGYQKVVEITPQSQGSEFYQLRFFATLKELKKSTVDPATGKIPERKFISPDEFLDYCPWGKIGKYIVDKAHELYKKKYPAYFLDFMAPLNSLLKFKEEINESIKEYHPKNVDENYLRLVSGNIKFIDLSEHIQRGLFEPNWDMLKRRKSDLRPILFLLIIGGLGKKLEEYIKFASILETIHNGTLIHDDIEDGAIIRRGDKPTYLKYGLDTAVNSANIMYFSPFILLRKYKNMFSDKIQIKAYESLIEHLNRVTWGQAIDILWHKEDSIPSLEQYFQMCCYKTGAIDRMVFSFAGAICGVDKKTQESLEDFGEDLGILLQIHDDFSDVCSINRELIGNKIIGNDISEGKKSIINILTLESLNFLEKQELLSILTEHTNNSQKIKRALELINKSNSLKKSLEISKSIVNRLVQKCKTLLKEKYNVKMEEFLLKLQEDMEKKYHSNKNGKDN